MTNWHSLLLLSLPSLFLVPIFGFDDEIIIDTRKCNDDCRFTSQWTRSHKATYEVHVSKLKFTHKWAQKYCHRLTRNGRRGKLINLTTGNLPYALDALEQRDVHDGWVDGASIPDLKDCCGRDRPDRNIALFRYDDGRFRVFPEKPCKKLHAICVIRIPNKHHSHEWSDYRDFDIDFDREHGRHHDNDRHRHHHPRKWDRDHGFCPHKEHHGRRHRRHHPRKHHERSFFRPHKGEIGGGCHQCHLKLNDNVFQEEGDGAVAKFYSSEIM